MFKQVFEALNAVKQDMRSAAVPPTGEERDYRRQLLQLCIDIVDEAANDGVIDIDTENMVIGGEY